MIRLSILRRFRPLMCLALLAAAPAALAQGPLTPPPGAPAPAMKSLDQVEARTPVQSLALVPPYTINQSGSYYLTGNITVADGNAILITTNGVTLDLNGFCIRSTRPDFSAGSAVLISPGLAGITVKNGSIASGTTMPAPGDSLASAGFNSGIYCSSAVRQVLVTDIQVMGTGTQGIYLIGQSVVERCTTTDTGGPGIRAQEIHHCSASNYSSAAISAIGNATGCSGSSVNGYGIQAQNAMNCSGTSTNGIGIQATNVTNCSGQVQTATAGGYGILGTTVTNSRGESPSGGSSVALAASIAIGCTYSGPISVPAGKTFNM